MLKLIIGENSFSRLEQLKQFKKSYAKESTEINEVDGESASLNDFILAASNQSLFSTSKVVFVYNFSRLPGLAEHLEDNFNTESSSDVIFVEAKPDKRSKIYKYLKKSCELTEHNEPKAYELGSWVRDKVQARGGSISVADANYLVEFCGTSQLILSGEIDKLLIITDQLTQDVINEHGYPTREHSIFEVLEDIFAGRVDPAIVQTKQMLRAKVEPIYFMSMMIWQLDNLASVFFNKNLADGEIAKKFKLNPYVVRKTRGQISSMSISSIKSLTDLLYQAERDIKIRNLDSRQTLLNLIASTSLTVKN